MAIADLKRLVKEMKPEVVEGKYFLGTIPEEGLMVIANYLEYIKCIYREEEGLTILFSEEIKEGMDELSSEKVMGPFAMITLTVNSDLFAVGFLEKITQAFKKEKISVNAFSAYFHDHLFVPYGEKEKAMEILKKLSSGK